MTSAQTYREHSESARRLAGRTAYEEDRLAFLSIARMWLKRAEHLRCSARQDSASPARSREILPIGAFAGTFRFEHEWILRGRTGDLK